MFVAIFTPFYAVTHSMLKFSNTACFFAVARPRTWDPNLRGRAYATGEQVSLYGLFGS